MKKKLQKFIALMKKVERQTKLVYFVFTTLLQSKPTKVNND